MILIKFKERIEKKYMRDLKKKQKEIKLLVIFNLILETLKY
jgi:hypothetical protein